MVEIGSFWGLSAEFILHCAPNAHLYCLDLWKAYKEQWKKESGAPDSCTIPEHNLQQCMSNLWPYRDQVTLLRNWSHLGLQELKKVNCQPEVIYIDGGHDYKTVKRDIEKSAEYFPDAVLCGDDYHQNFPGVIQAVNEFSRVENRKLVTHGQAWKYSTTPFGIQIQNRHGGSFTAGIDT